MCGFSTFSLPIHALIDMRCLHFLAVGPSAAMNIHSHTKFCVGVCFFGVYTKECDYWVIGLFIW